MPSSIADPPVARQSTSADLSRTTDCERWLGLLRQAMTETGWTQDALAAHWQIDRAYVSRLVNGEKPWSVQRTLSLPRDLKAKLAHLCAEAVGLIVLTPLSGAEAQKAFAAGLIGMMAAPALPEKADRPAKAQLRTEPKKATA